MIIAKEAPPAEPATVPTDFVLLLDEDFLLLVDADFVLLVDADFALLFDADCALLVDAELVLFDLNLFMAYKLFLNYLLKETSKISKLTSVFNCVVSKNLQTSNKKNEQS